MSATAHPRRRPAAIVGAGIGGLTFALALGRAGMPFEVYEQAEAFTEVGAGIQLAPNAVRVLHRLGLREALAEHAVRVDVIETRRWDTGAPVAGLALGEACERLYGAPYYTIHRARLHAVLAEALRALRPGSVSLGHRLTGLDDGPDGAVLRFADGRTRSAAVAVGADGVHSRVRATIVSDAPVPSGTDVYRGLVPADRAPAALRAPRVRVWAGPGQHCVTYPVSPGTISFAATVPGAGGGQGESWTAGGDPEHLAAAYRGWHPALRALLAAAPDVRRWSLHDRDPVTRWCGTRVALLGDAAHPMLPFMAQGANQAVEDAVTLAVCLGNKRAVPDALRHYAALRIPRTAAVQEGSRANASALHLADGDEQRRRDDAMRSADGPGAMAWLYGHDAEAVAAAGRTDTAMGKDASSAIRGPDGHHPPVRHENRARQ